MSEQNNTPIIHAAGAAVEENQYEVSFSKPYKFEGKDYTKLDLSGMENLTAEHMIAADKYITGNGNFSPMSEMNLEYALYIASVATDLPIEFFRRLPPREAIKIKNRVTNFFYGEG